jgi:hypothetical protein
MLHQVQQAIVPHLPMKRTIRRWNDIAEGLAEPRRQRRAQVDAVMDLRLQCPKAVPAVAS